MNERFQPAKYPDATDVEDRLKQLAIETGNQDPKPFRVDVVRVHGGKPPLYSIVIRAADKESLRKKLEPLLRRPLRCGLTSFMMLAEEAVSLLKE